MQKLYQPFHSTPGAAPGIELDEIAALPASDEPAHITLLSRTKPVLGLPGLLVCLCLAGCALGYVLPQVVVVLTLFSIGVYAKLMLY